MESGKPSRKTGAGTRGTRGFTLIEALVALALFSLISLLMWQAMAWIARVDERLGEAWRFSSQEALRAEWVRAAVRGAVSGGAGDPNTYRGSPREIEMYSVAPPWTDRISPLWMKLSIVPGAEAGSTRILASAEGSEQITLWAGETRDRAQIAFQFLDEDGLWHSQWPPQPGVVSNFGIAAQVLPEGLLPVAVKINGMPNGAWLVVLDAQTHTLPTRSIVGAQ